MPEYVPNAHLRVDQDISHPQRDLYFALSFNLPNGTLSTMGSEVTMNAYIAFRATIQVAHVRDVSFELALYLLRRTSQYQQE